jgi:hypothetical protein
MFISTSKTVILLQSIIVATFGVSIWKQNKVHLRMVCFGDFYIKILLHYFCFHAKSKRNIFATFLGSVSFLVILCNLLLGTYVTTFS